MINFHYFEEGKNAGLEDLESVVCGVELVRKLSKPIGEFIAEEELPGKGVQGKRALEEWVKSYAWGHHASCTCQIGPPTEPMAVIDSNFRVYGTRGLRIVDASVFPRIPGFFIVAAVYMIAEKACDAILKDVEVSMTPNEPSTTHKPSRPHQPEEKRARQLVWPTAGVAVLLVALLGTFLISPEGVGTVDLLSQQLDRLSLLPQWAFPLVVIVLALDLLLTLVHSIQELNGRNVALRRQHCWGSNSGWVGIVTVLLRTDGCSVGCGFHSDRWIPLRRRSHQDGGCMGVDRSPFVRQLELAH